MPETDPLGLGPDAPYGLVDVAPDGTVLAIVGVPACFLQAAVAVLLAGAVTLKHSWHRVRELFRSSSRKQSDLDLDD